VLLIGTLDTKGAEISWTAAEIERLGCDVLVLDSGVSGRPTLADVAFPREDVARAAGVSLAELQALDRGDAVARMADGVKRIAIELADDGRIDGALCIGGAGVSLAVPAFQALGHGFPKLMVTPLASGMRRFEAFVDTRDVALMHSVADIQGINGITGPVFRQAAGYIAGAAQATRGARHHEGQPGKPMIGASMNGNTTPALMLAHRLLGQAGYELVTFHANGVGGRALEDFVRDGAFAAVLDYTTTEIGGTEIGGLMYSGPGRMEVAGEAGIPQVLVPGCLDLITVGPYEDALQEYPGRALYRHNPQFTLVRLNRQEMEQLARTFARKANHSVGPTAICVPLGGFSIPNVEGGPFWSPEADGAFVDTLRAALSKSVRLELIGGHINDATFVERTVHVLLELIEHGARAPRGKEVAVPR
jgi:uncharacterized protein (UPF0261 family)